MALWTPSLYTATAKIWTVSDDPGNTLVSTDLSVLADKGGGGFNYVAGSTTAYGARSTTLNSRTVLTGNGSTKQLGLKSTGAVGFAQNQPGMTIFVVNRMTTPTSVSDNPMVHFSRNGASNTRLTLSRATSSAGDVTLGVRRLDADGYTQITTGTNHGSGWNIICGQVNFVAGTGLIRVNGATVTSGALGTSGGNSSNTASTIAGIGEYDDVAQGAWGHDEAEIIIVQGVLSLADIQYFEGYLASPGAWGLQSILDAGHPYKSAAPTAVNIVAADAAVDGIGEFLGFGSKVLGMVTATLGDHSDLFTVSKLLGAVGQADNTDLDVYLASAVTSAASDMQGDGQMVDVGGAIGAGVSAILGDHVDLFDSNAIASGQSDLVATGDASTLFNGGAIAGFVGDLQGADSSALVSGAIIAASYSVPGDAAQAYTGGFIQSAGAVIVADALALWTTSFTPGDGGSTLPAPLNRRMTRIPQFRAMTRSASPRSMTR